MATCYNRYTRQYYTCASRWSNWGRWVALAVIIGVAFLLFFLCACISQRRRRKAGRTPFYGTGWTTKLPGGNVPQGQSNYQPPPVYNQYGNNQGTGTAPAGGYYNQDQNNHNQTGGANQSYFGGRSDVEMQRPDAVYNNNNYAAPSGPPPGKNY